MKNFFAALLFCLFFSYGAFAGACPFCNPGVISDQKVYENNLFYVLVDYAPVTEGHFLVIPKRHVVKAHELSQEEWQGLSNTIPKVVTIFQKALNTDQYIMLEKNGRFAGQMVPHVHFHLIPIPSEKLSEKIKESLFAKMYDRPQPKLNNEELQNTVNKYRKFFSENE